MRTSSFIPYRPGTQQTRNAKGAADFLHAHDKMAAILPIVTRIAALQKDCAAILPAMFKSCSVFSFESDQLVLAIPNAAIASKLKQQVPKLVENLRSRGWQVIAIRLKVQVTPEIAKKEIVKQLALPPDALTALANLNDALESTRGNQTLKAALANLLQRHRKNR